MMNPSMNSKIPSQCLQGAPALDSVRAILAEPGVCSIDFETYPTAPKWHGDQAAQQAPRGKQGAARKVAELEALLDGRAHKRQACTLQLAHEDGREAFVKLLDPERELPEMFEPITDCRPWEDCATLVAHNAQFETEVLLKHGVAVDVECTLVAAKCLYLVAVPEDEPQPVRFGLADLVEREYGHTRDKTVRDRDWREPPDDEAVVYGLADVRDCLALWQLYKRRLREAGLFDGYRAMQCSILPTAALNVRGGLALDIDAHDALLAEMRTTAKDVGKELDQASGGTITTHGSDKQVSDWIIREVMGPANGLDRRELMGRFAIKIHARTGGAVKGWRVTAKTGNLALRRGGSLRKAEQLVDAFPTVAEYLVKRARWRKATKLWQSFGPTLRRWQDSDGIAKGQHKNYGAWTGRQSCVNPNLQNQPHDETFRALWVARPGRKLIIADYSQIELRLLAIVAGDERLREVYRAGRDVHQETADIAGIPRKDAKSVNFAMAYGSGAAGLSENFGFTLDESRRIIDRVLGAYPGLARYREIAPREAARQGYISIRPNRRVVYDAKSPGTTAINAPIQGGAASVQMRALRLVYDALQSLQGASGRATTVFSLPTLVAPIERVLGAQQSGTFDVVLAASVHDEIILDAAEKDAGEAADLLVDCMTLALLEVFPEAEDMGLARLTTPSKVERWSEKA